MWTWNWVSGKNYTCRYVFGTVYANQPAYLYDLISLQPPRSTRSSSIVTLAHPPTRSSLKITDRSFRHASPRLWNQLPNSFRQPRRHLSLPDSPLSQLTSSPSSSPLSQSITPSLFHSKLKTFLFHKSLDHTYHSDWLNGSWTISRFHTLIGVFLFSFSLLVNPLFFLLLMFYFLSYYLFLVCLLFFGLSSVLILVFFTHF